MAVAPEEAPELGRQQLLETVRKRDAALLGKHPFVVHHVLRRVQHPADVFWGRQLDPAHDTPVFVVVLPQIRVVARAHQRTTALRAATVHHERRNHPGLLRDLDEVVRVPQLLGHVFGFLHRVLDFVQQGALVHGLDVLRLRPPHAVLVRGSRNRVQSALRQARLLLQKAPLPVLHVLARRGLRKTHQDGDGTQRLLLLDPVGFRDVRCQERLPDIQNGHVQRTHPAAHRHQRHVLFDAISIPLCLAGAQLRRDTHGDSSIRHARATARLLRLRHARRFHRRAYLQTKLVWHDHPLPAPRPAKEVVETPPEQVVESEQSSWLGVVLSGTQPLHVRSCGATASSFLRTAENRLQQEVVGVAVGGAPGRLLVQRALERFGVSVFL
mmetsp:Transcript_15910/g.39387  ORF Transcript_15910/g.39387 Transcript_15910/m.39387 type:complete len:383 (-) Transcript_15910:816-1964(-)